MAIDCKCLARRILDNEDFPNTLETVSMYIENYLRDEIEDTLEDTCFKGSQSLIDLLLPTHIDLKKVNKLKTTALCNMEKARAVVVSSEMFQSDVEAALQFLKFATRALEDAQKELLKK